MSHNRSSQNLKSPSPEFRRHTGGGGAESTWTICLCFTSGNYTSLALWGGGFYSGAIHLRVIVRVQVSKHRNVFLAFCVLDWGIICFWFHLCFCVGFAWIMMVFCVFPNIYIACYCVWLLPLRQYSSFHPPPPSPQHFRSLIRQLNTLIIIIDSYIIQLKLKLGQRGGEACRSMSKMSESLTPSKRPGLVWCTVLLQFHLQPLVSDLLY